MTAVLITYDVDDVQAWLASPTRTAKERSALPQDEQSEATEIGERVGRRSTVE